jgi:hypothetical protein
MNILGKSALSLVSEADLGRKRLGARNKMLKVAPNQDVLSEIFFSQKVNPVALACGRLPVLSLEPQERKYQIPLACC